jgi:predicted house-cleaning noncanonical NTP pyrophosphatase (MazG superfamily)
MTMQVKDLTTEELKALIRETVLETLEEFLEDPDEGKEIRPEVKQELIESMQRTQAGARGVSLEEVTRRLGFAQ